MGIVALDKRKPEYAPPRSVNGKCAVVLGSVISIGLSIPPAEFVRIFLGC